MAKLDFKLTPEQHGALEESLKQYYVPTQDGGYELDGVGSIQRALEAEKKAKGTTKPELVAELEELRQFKQAQEDAKAQAAQQDLERQGKYEEAQAAKDLAWQQRVDAANAEKDSLLANIKRERLTNELVKRGVLADRAEYLVDKMAADIDLVKGDAGYELKTKTGIGDATDFEAVIQSAKEKTPFFFAASGTPGSGATGSDGKGATGTNSDMSAAAKLESFYSGNK